MVQQQLPTWFFSRLSQSTRPWGWFGPKKNLLPTKQRTALVCFVACFCCLLVGGVEKRRKISSGWWECLHTIFRFPARNLALVLARVLLNLKLTLCRHSRLSRCQIVPKMSSRLSNLNLAGFESGTKRVWWWSSGTTKCAIWRPTTTSNEQSTTTIPNILWSYTASYHHAGHSPTTTRRKPAFD